MTFFPTLLSPKRQIRKVVPRKETPALTTGLTVSSTCSALLILLGRQPLLLSSGKMILAFHDVGQFFVIFFRLDPNFFYSFLFDHNMELIYSKNFTNHILKVLTQKLTIEPLIISFKPSSKVHKHQCVRRSVLLRTISGG